MFNFNDLLKLSGNAQQFQEFKKNILTSGVDPKTLLINEIKKKGITSDQLQQLEQVAQLLQKIGLK